MAIDTESGILSPQTQTLVYTSVATFSAQTYLQGDQWTNSDDVPMATFVLTANWSGAPVAGETINLYSRLMNINGTGDMLEPNTDESRRYLLGTFRAPASATGTHYIPLFEGIVNLPAVQSQQVHEFWFRNSCTTGGDIASGMTLHITPIVISGAA